MSYLRSSSQRFSNSPFLATSIRTTRNAALAAFLFASLTCLGQDQQPAQTADSQPQTAPNATVTIPAGTQLALVLTHPVQSRTIHRGDDIYAQITSPVTAENQVAIPPGTFVQGTVEKLELNRGRGEVLLRSMAITFPDGYVAPVAGPITLESTEGYALKDPGSKRTATMLLFPAAGAGLGALIGHSVGSSSSTITNTLPPGCTGLPPGCLTSSITGPGTKGRDTAIGAGAGVAIGMVASMAAVFSSHQYFLDVGSPVEMTLQQPITLRQSEVTAAVRKSAEHPVAMQPVEPRPAPPPPPDTPIDHGTCYTPSTPPTPPTVIPGPPGPDGTPGTPTIIPGSPGIPGTPYPCP